MLAKSEKPGGGTAPPLVSGLTSRQYAGDPGIVGEGAALLTAPCEESAAAVERDNFRISNARCVCLI